MHTDNSIQGFGNLFDLPLTHQRIIVSYVMIWLPTRPHTQTNFECVFHQRLINIICEVAYQVMKLPCLPLINGYDCFSNQTYGTDLKNVRLIVEF